MVMKPQKMKAYGSFTEWKQDQTKDNQKLINALARIVKKTAPNFTPFVKWGQGCWVLGDTPKVYIHAEADHVQMGFYAGSKLKDPRKLLVGKGKYVRHVKIYSTNDIPSEALTRFIKQVL